MVVAFPGNKFKGEVIPALAELVESGTIRIIDFAFVAKDAKGNVAAFEIEDLDSDVGAAFQTLQAAIGDLVNAEDLERVGEGLEPNMSAALLVWEDVWATKLANAISDAGGVLIDIQRVPREIVTAALEASTVKL
jgi:hypothetical protein